jgi:hypothetical protein
LVSNLTFVIFFKLESLKRNYSVLSAMFLGDTCLQKAHEILPARCLFEARFAEEFRCGQRCWGFFHTTQKSPEPEGISPLILKKIVRIVNKLLAVLFNLSLLSEVFSCVWKKSYVVPLLKIGEKRNFLNCRFISNLSAFPKLFEKLVCNVITPIIRS